VYSDLAQLSNIHVDIRNNIWTTLGQLGPSIVHHNDCGQILISREDQRHHLFLQKEVWLRGVQARGPRILRVGRAIFQVYGDTRLADHAPGASYILV